jgi:hypothetical protein
MSHYHIVTKYVYDFAAKTLGQYDSKLNCRSSVLCEGVCIVMIIAHRFEQRLVIVKLMSVS